MTIPPTGKDTTVISEKKTERLEHSVVRLSITVPAAESKKVYDSMMRDYIKNARVDGFRQGRVPASVLERKFGEALKSEALGRIIEEAVEEAVKGGAESPLMYSTPSVEGEPVLDMEKDLSFSVVYDAYPIFTAPDWRGLEITVPDAAVSPEDLEREIAQLRDRNAIVVEKDGIVAKGDIVTLDYAELDESGAAIADRSRKDFTFETGTGYNIYKFDDEIIGMAKGETRIIEKTYASDFEYQDLAGRTVKISLTVTKVKEKQLPALDDEFAQDISEKYQTFQDLESALRTRMERSLEERIKHIKESAILEALRARTQIDLPESMINAELGMRWENLKRQTGMDSDEKLEMLALQSGRPRDALLAEWRPTVERALCSRLILDKLIEDGAYTCSDEELEAHLAIRAEEHSMSSAELRAEYEKHNALEQMRDEVKEQRLFADILAAATVTVGERLSYVDVLRDNQ